MITEYILVFFVVFLISFVIVEKWNGKKRQSDHHAPPSLPVLPLVGSLPFLRNFNNIAEFFMMKSNELGSIFTFRVGKKLVLMLNNREVIEEAFVQNSRSFSSRLQFYSQQLVNPKIKGIAFLDTTPEWKHVHQLSLAILKAFGFGNKHIMEERILKETEAMVEFVRKKEGKCFDPKELSIVMTGNIINQILFATRSSYDIGISKLMATSHLHIELAMKLLWVTPHLELIPRINRWVSKFKMHSKNLYDSIELEIYRCIQNNEICFVTEYIKNEGSNYDRDQLNFLVRDLMQGGSETTSTTFLWALVSLANNPEIQKKLQAEIDSVIGRDRLPTLQDQAKLSYVEATILELYRWRPLVTLVARQTSRDSILRGFSIPAGTLVIPNLYAVHCDPKCWKDPDVFRPERFLDENGNVFGRNRIIPFSLGRRSCPGEILARAEIFLIITRLLQRFTVLPPEGQDKISHKPLMPITVLTVPLPFSIRLIERK